MAIDEGLRHAHDDVAVLVLFLVHAADLEPQLL